MMKAFFNLRCIDCRRNRLVFAFMVFAFSCTEDVKDNALSSIEKKELVNLSLQLGIPTVDNKMILIIPTQGCAPCIKAALGFASRNDSTKLSVVLSGKSLKQCTLLLAKFSVDVNRVVIDEKGSSMKKGLVNIFPVLFKKTHDATLAIELDADNIGKVFSELGIEY